MGSNKSKPEEPPPRRSPGLCQADLERQRKQLEAEKTEWQQQQIREQHWREQQAREEQKLRETALEWKRQAELRQLKVQQQKLQKELEEQKLQRQAEQEEMRKLVEEQRHQREQQTELRQLKLQQEKLQREVEEQKLQRQADEQDKIQKQLREQQQQRERLPVQRVQPQLNSQAQFQNKLFQQAQLPIILPSIPPSTFFRSRETVAVQQKAPSDANNAAPLNPKTTTKSNATTPVLESTVEYVKWSIIDYVKDNNSINEMTAKNIIKLFNSGNTVPFIARYRRHLTHGMDPDKLRKVRDSYEQAKLIKQLASALIKILEEKSKLTPEINAYVHETKSLLDLQHVQSIFVKAPAQTVKRAEKLGLSLVAQFCMENKNIPLLSNLVKESVDGLKTEKEIKDGIVGLMADDIIRDRRTFDVVTILRSKHSMEIETTKSKAKRDKLEDDKYQPYYNFKSMDINLEARHVFAINKGESLDALTVKINIPSDFERDFKRQCQQQFGVTENTLLPNRLLIDAAIDLAYERSVKYSVAKRTRQEITQRAQNWAIDDLARNIKQHLIAPPLRVEVVLGIKPGFDEGCKIAVLSEQGRLLEAAKIYPHNLNNPQDKIDGERNLVRMIFQHKCNVVARGDGQASKETEIFLVRVLKNDKIASFNIVHMIVDESISNSREAALEFPGLEAGVVSAISIARCLQDPISELAKIEPELLVVDMHHDVFSAGQMSAKIDEVIVEIINDVGVDANTASLSLLKKVAGLDEAKAKSIIDWRRSFGPFLNRNDLLKVEGISKKVFKQCAGFMRIVADTAISKGAERIFEGSFNFFDRTWIHPESYDLAKSLVEAARCDIAKIGSISFRYTLKLFAQTGSANLAKKFDTNAETIEMVIQGLLNYKSVDMRDKEDAKTLRKASIKFDDLSRGDVLIGKVTHLVASGVLVNVGGKLNGLMHRRYMNGMTVHVGQKVEVRVGDILKEPSRLRFALIKTF